MRIRSMIALAVLGALAVVALAIPAMARDDEGARDRHGGHADHERRGGHDRPSLGSGGKITLKLLENDEAQTLADIYASEDTGKKVKRAMRRGLIVHCHPRGYDTASFTCEGETTPPEATPPETTTPGDDHPGDDDPGDDDPGDDHPSGDDHHHAVANS